MPRLSPISRATTSIAALSGGNNRATALSLNACPYRATVLFHRRPKVGDSIEATTSLTQVSLPGGQIRDNRSVWWRLRLQAPIRTSRLRVEVWDSADSTSARIVELEAWSAPANADAATAAPTELRYLHRDALGSVNAITDEQGQLVERLAYDPWGKRRYPNGGADPEGLLAARSTDRGFTLHEHLDEVGLVHMNARLYDPLLGRFASADSIVDGALDLQGYNRYSYGRNSPTAGADPSGHSFWSNLNPFSSANLDQLFNHLSNPFSAHELHLLIHRDPGIQIGDQLVQRYPVVGQIAQVAVVAVVSYFTGGLAAPWAAAAIAGAAGGSAAMVTYAQGGDQGDYWRAGLVSAATAAAFYGVGQATVGMDAAVKVGAHAVVGCASAAASGGDCAHGAMAAAVGKSVSLGLELKFGPDGANWAPHEKVIGFIATTVAGGTASAIGGGKFANGAMTAAFGYLLNQLQQELTAAQKKAWGEAYAESKLALPSDRVFRNVQAYAIVDGVRINIEIDRIIIDQSGQYMKTVEVKWGESASYTPNQRAAATQIATGEIYMKLPGSSIDASIPVNQQVKYEHRIFSINAVRVLRSDVTRTRIQSGARLSSTWFLNMATGVQ